MASAPPRRDEYGKPIPPLVDAEHELRYERAFNKQQRKLMFDELEKIYRALLRRNINAVVTLCFIINDGMIYTEFSTDVKLTHVGPHVPDDVYLQQFEDGMRSRGVPDDIRQRLMEKRKKQRYGHHPHT